MNEEIFTPAQSAEIAAYHFPHYLWDAVGHVVNIGVFMVILFWLLGPMYRLAERSAAALDARFGGFLRRAPVTRVAFSALDRLWGERGWGAAVLFTIYDYLLVAIIFLPLETYFGYFLEHRFGLSRYTPVTYAIDHIKVTVTALVPMVALAFGLFGLARRLKLWWLVLGVATAGVLLGSAMLDPYRAQVYFKQRPLEAGVLREKITALMTRAGVDFRDVLVEENSVATVKVQAYFAGQGPTRTIVLNDSLLAVMTDGEVLGAVAHEAAHTREPRWLGRIGSALALMAFLFAVDRVLRVAASRHWLGTTRFADIRTLPLMTLLFYLASGAAKPVSAAFSRERERQADLYALRLTQDPATFRGMLVKVARNNKIDPSPPRWVVVLGLSHPPISDRIAAVDRGDWKEAGDR